MNAVDLMIGDWVQTTYPTGKVEYRKVEGVMQNHIICNNGVTNAIEPIPITKEILEKNGWECVGDEDTEHPIMQMYEGRDAFWWTLKNGECGCERSVADDMGEEDFERNFFCYQVGYVHELQHALRLCGIEKEIVL